MNTRKRSIAKAQPTAPAAGTYPLPESADMAVLEAGIIDRDLALVSHREVLGGFAATLLLTAARLMDLAPDELAARCGLSRSTFRRKVKTRARLGINESDAVARHFSLFKKAEEVFESAEAANRWLSEPQPGLDNQRPLDLAVTTAGFREVEKLLTRIDYGVYA